MERTHKLLRRLRISVLILKRTFLLLRSLSFSSVLFLLSCLVLLFIKVVGDMVSSFYSTSLRILSDSVGGRSYVFLLCNGILIFLVLFPISSLPPLTEKDHARDHDHDGDDTKKLVAGDGEVYDRQIMLLLHMSCAGEEHKRIETDQEGGQMRNATTLYEHDSSECKHSGTKFNNQTTGVIMEGGSATTDEDAGDEWCSLSTEELNKRCEDFIRKMRQGIISERRSWSYPSYIHDNK